MLHLLLSLAITLSPANTIQASITGNLTSVQYANKVPVFDSSVKPGAAFDLCFNYDLDAPNTSSYLGVGTYQASDPATLNFGNHSIRTHANYLQVTNLFNDSFSFISKSSPDLQLTLLNLQLQGPSGIPLFNYARLPSQLPPLDRFAYKRLYFYSSQAYLEGEITAVILPEPATLLYLLLLVTVFGKKSCEH